MSLLFSFKEAIKTRYPDIKLSELSTTRHANVLLLEGTIAGKEQRAVAKTIWHDKSDAADAVRANKAFETEVAILKILPAWWGIQYLDSFKSDDEANRIIITSEYPSRAWSTIKAPQFGEISRSIKKQLDWLHSKKIAHGDMELKNVLLSKRGIHATVIDFEKAIRGASKELMLRDVAHIIENAKELNASFGRNLDAMFHRRKSMTRRRKTANNSHSHSHSHTRKHKTK